MLATSLIQLYSAGADTIPKVLETSLVERVGNALMTKIQVQFGRLQSRSTDAIALRLRMVREEFASQTLELLCSRYCNMEPYFRSAHGLASALQWQRTVRMGFDVSKLASSHEKLKRMGRTESLESMALDKNVVVYGGAQLFEASYTLYYPSTFRNLRLPACRLYMGTHACNYVWMCAGAHTRVIEINTSHSMIPITGAIVFTEGRSWHKCCSVLDRDG
jgi:hypothetical protein